MTDRYCLYCGKKANNNWQTCEVCGAPYDVAPAIIESSGETPMPPPPAINNGSKKVVVAISVVVIIMIVFAIFYVMVIGFSDGGALPPAGGWTNVEATDYTTARLTFSRFTTDVEPMDLKFFITPSGGLTTQSATQVSFSSSPSSQTSTMYVTGGVFTAEYTDYNYQGNMINSGDYITLSGLTSETTYTVSILHIPSDTTVSMTGISGTWTQPQQPTSTPAGAWNDVSAVDTTSAKLVFGQFTTDVEPMDFRFYVRRTGFPTGVIQFSSAPSASTTTWDGGNVSYFDYNYQGNLINSGDYLIIGSLISGATYTIEVFHIDSEATVSMTGDGATWTQP